MSPRVVVAVVGSASPTLAGHEAARRVGSLLARRGAVVLCGGRGGVMEAAALGAAEEGGLSLGLLPGPDLAEANPHLTIALPTGLGFARNAVIAQAAGGLIGIEGELGTLSELALGLKLGKPVVTLACPWDLPGLIRAASPEEAVAILWPLIQNR
jgi:uncharacterized protein (TIGR00725 family)